jgi:hypothetical protein
MSVREDGSKEQMFAKQLQRTADGSFSIDIDGHITYVFLMF